jgi:hypothetical protein
MQIVAAYPTSELAYLAASRLESSGIEVEVRDEATIAVNWIYSPVIGGVKIAVDESEVADALEILRQLPTEEGILTCPHCGSREVTVRTLSPAGGIFLVLNVPLPLALQTADCRSCGKSHTLSAHPQWG